MTRSSLSEQPELLAIYLNDHLAGATGGTELARRMAHTHPAEHYGAAMEQLAGEIAQDRDALVRIMRRLHVRTNPVKTAVGWLGEKLGRLKLNGRLFTKSPLSVVLELELLRLGVEGKAAAWRTLRERAERDKRLDPGELDRLIARAKRQIETLENLRVDAVRQVLVAERD